MRHQIINFVLLFSFMWAGPILGQQSNVNLERLDVIGYQAIFSTDGTAIAYIDGESKEYRKYSFESNNDIELNISAKGSLFIDLLNERLLLKENHGDDHFVHLDITSGEKTNFSLAEKLIVYPSENLRAIILQKGKVRKEIVPLELVDYINVSLSPDQSKILFRASGIGTFVSDLDGNILATFDSAQFPTWVSNSMILYANVSDDGYQYTSSTLFYANITSQELRKIDLEKNLIPLYPRSNKDGSKIIFNTPEYHLYVLSPE